MQPLSWRCQPHCGAIPLRFGFRRSPSSYSRRPKKSRDFSQCFLAWGHRLWRSSSLCRPGHTNIPAANRTLSRRIWRCDFLHHESPPLLLCLSFPFEFYENPLCRHFSLFLLIKFKRAFHSTYGPLFCYLRKRTLLMNLVKVLLFR